MGQTDFFQPVTKVKKELTFEFKEFYSMLKSWLKDRGYGTAELDHADLAGSDGYRKIDISLGAEKKFDPYVKIVMEIGISAKLKDVTIEEDDKVVTAQEGTLEVGIGGFLKKDSEDEWKVRDASIWRKFLRDVYDKFVGNDKFEGAESKLADDIKKVVHDLKTYLKLHRFD